MANVTSSGHFSPIREKSDLLAEDEGKAAYVLNWLCQQESTKVEGSGWHAFDGRSRRVLGPLGLAPPGLHVAGNVCLKALFAS